MPSLVPRFLLVAMAVVRTARADYDSPPPLRPEARRGMMAASVESANDPGGVASVHCQHLFWDLSAVTRLGFVAAAAPMPGLRTSWYPNGASDRPPPLFTKRARARTRSPEKR